MAYNKEASQKYREKNREILRAKGKLYREQNRDKDLARKIRYRKENIEKIREYDRKYRAEHRAERIAYDKKRQHIKKNAIGTFSKQEWEEMKEKYNFTCLSCNKAEPYIKLTADHVIPLSLGGSNDISNIQPLCIGCNSSKKQEFTDFRLSSATLSNVFVSS